VEFKGVEHETEKLAIPSSQDRPYEWMSLPIRCGGAGLRPAAVTARPAYWGSYAQYLSKTRTTLPGPDTYIAKELHRIYAHFTQEGVEKDLLPPSPGPDTIKLFYSKSRIPKLQKKITANLDQIRMSRVNPSDEERILIQSTTSPESTSILTLFPTEPHFTLLQHNSPT